MSPVARASSQRRRPATRAAVRPQETPDLPRFLIAGSHEVRMARIARSLEGLRVRVERSSWEEALEALKEKVAGLVLVLPLRRVAMATAVHIVRDHPDGKDLLLYAVVPDHTSSRRVRSLYTADATAVFEWPRDQSVLKSLFAESFGMTLVRGRSKKADKALARNVRARLRLYPELGGDRLRLFCRDGLITVSGQVRLLAHRDEIIDTIVSVPGVRAVIAQSLQVAPSGIPDSTLKRRIRSLMHNATELDGTTISIQVRNGQVELSGTVGDPAEARRLEQLIVNLKGIRGLTSRLSATPEQQRQDRHLTLRYRRALETLYPKEKISLTVVDGIAILSGGVRSLPVKRSLARLLSRDAAIRRVVDKIAVK